MERLKAWAISLNPDDASYVQAIQNAPTVAFIEQMAVRQIRESGRLFLAALDPEFEDIDIIDYSSLTDENREWLNSIPREYWWAREKESGLISIVRYTPSHDEDMTCDVFSNDSCFSKDDFEFLEQIPNYKQ